MGLDFAKYGLAQAGNNIGNVVQLPHIKHENGSNSRNSGDMLVNLLRLGVALATTPATITPASKQKFQKFTKIRASQREEEMQMVPKYPKSSDVVEKEEGNHSQPQLKAAESGYSNDQLVNSQLESILKVLAKKKVDELDALTRQTTTENPEIVRMREKMQQLEARLMEQQEMLLKKDIEDKYGKIIRRHHGDSEEYTRAPDQEDYMPEIRFKQIKDQFHPHQFEKEATPTSSYQKILPLSKIALTKTIPVTPNPSRKLEMVETSSNTNTTSSSITSSEMSTRIELPTTTKFLSSIASSSSNMTQVTTHTTIPATSIMRTLLERSKDNQSSTTLELNQTSTVTTNLSSTTGIIHTYTNPKTPDLTSTETSQTSLLTTKISSTTGTTNTHPEASETDLTTASTSETSQTSLLTTEISSTTGTNTHPEISETDLTTTSTSEKSQTSLLTTEISSTTGTNTHPETSETDLTTASTSETSQTSLLTTEISSTTGTNTQPETSETDLTTTSNLDATTSTTDPQVSTMKDSSTTQTISHEQKLLLVKTFEEKSIPTGLYKMDEYTIDIQSSPSNTTQPLILHDLDEKRNRKSHFDKYRINQEKNQPSQGTITTNGTEMSPEIRTMIEKIKLLARHLLIKEVEYEKKEQKLQKLFSIMKSEKAKARLKSFQKTTPKKLRTTTQSSTTSTSEEPITTPTRRPISTSTKISKVEQRVLIAKSKLKALLKRRIPIRSTSTSTYPTSTSTNEEDLKIPNDFVDRNIRDIVDVKKFARMLQLFDRMYLN